MTILNFTSAEQQFVSFSDSVFFFLNLIVIVRYTVIVIYLHFYTNCNIVKPTKIKSYKLQKLYSNF